MTMFSEMSSDILSSSFRLTRGVPHSYDLPPLLIISISSSIEDSLMFLDIIEKDCILES